MNLFKNYPNLDHVIQTLQIKCTKVNKGHSEDNSVNLAELMQSSIILNN